MEREIVEEESVPTQPSEVTIPVKKSRVNKRKESKRNRNYGLEYKSASGKTCDKREIGNDCMCPKKCYDRIQKEDREKVFEAFWKYGDYDLQNSYLHGRIKICAIKRRYTKKDESRRNNTVFYTVLNESLEVNVCKKAFLNIHGLQKSRGRVEQLVKKMSAGLCSPPVDKRGLHDARPKYSAEQNDSALAHIQSIPTYKSHYSRKDNPNKVYFGHEYSYSNLYEDYAKIFCKEKHIQPVSKEKYVSILKTLNIGFKHPKSDTCKTCDSLHIKIKQCRLTNDSSELHKLLTNQQLHHRKAEAGLEMIKEFRKEAKEDDGLFVFTFDLQQALPLPKLSTGPAFYSRKLWGYNISIHDCKNEQGFFYFWDESTAGRGSEEIGSCLKKHFEQYDIKGERLVMISDNCGGQNKNWVIVSLWSFLVSTKRFKTVSHYFPIPGHTLLPSDQDFGHIESFMRRHAQDVYTPEQWVSIIEKSCHKKSLQLLI